MSTPEDVQHTPAPGAFSERDLSVVVLNDHCFPQGGASRVAIDEAVALAEQGVSVTFIGAVGPICPELTAAPLRVECLDQEELAIAHRAPSVLLQGIWNAKAYRATEAVLAKCDPRRTIVHLHAFAKALSISPVRRALQSGFRVVCTLHDFFAACPNGAFFDYVTGKPCSRRALSPSCVLTNCDKRHYSHKVYRVARTAVQSRMGAFPSGIAHYITLSERSAEILRPYLPASARLYRIPNPIEVARLPPVDAAANNDVVAIGRLDPEKGIEVLLTAAQRAATSITFVGDGSLRSLAVSSGIARVTGWVPRGGVQSELERARCLVFPSVCYETYGLTVDEAAARGVPAIVSDISAAAERVEDGMTGWHVRSGDADDLAAKLIRIRDDHVVRQAGKAAYARFWTSPPSRQHHTEQLLQAYRDILSSKRG